MKKLLRADMMEREAGYRIIDERYFDRAENVSKLKFTQKSTIFHAIWVTKTEISLKKLKNLGQLHCQSHKRKSAVLRTDASKWVSVFKISENSKF